jgi:hypothetical protein
LGMENTSSKQASMPIDLVEDLGDLLSQPSEAPPAANPQPPQDPNNPIPPEMTSNVTSAKDAKLPFAFSSIEGLFPGQPIAAEDPLRPSTNPSAKPGDSVDLSKIIRSGEKNAKLVPVYTKIKCEVLDIASDKGAERYCEIMQMITDSKGKIIPYQKETEPHYIPDPKAPKGCRVIVIMKYCSADSIVERDPNKQYTQVSPPKFQ